MIKEIDTLYKINASKGMQVIWQKNIYLTLKYDCRFARIAVKWRGRDYTLQNARHLSEALQHLFKEANDAGDLYADEKKIPYIGAAVPYIMFKEGTYLGDTYRYVPAFPGLTINKIGGEGRLTKVENKVNRLCKHVGKLTNELRQSKTKTLRDLPVSKLDYDELLNITHNDKIVAGMFKREEEKVLCLDVSPITGSLRILYKKHSEKANSDIHLIGQITGLGQMDMLRSITRNNSYEEWRKADKISPNSTIDQTSIIWRGAEYAIISRPLGFGTVGGYYLKNVTIGQDIYNFSICLPCSPISDIHIKKYSNGTPMLF